jgi:osmotically-inducible protein OsmY
MNLTAQDLSIGFDGASVTLIVLGIAATQEDKEKILLCCGNVVGVENVQDQLGVLGSAV